MRPSFQIPSEASELGWHVTSQAEGQALSSELAREMPKGHRLKSLISEAVAHRVGRDDVLFALSDGRLAVVHLTWNRETDPVWPFSTVYDSVEAWIDAEREERQWA